jgi:hypothetical protein
MVGSAAVTHPAILSQGCATIAEMVKTAPLTIDSKINVCGRRMRHVNSWNPALVRKHRRTKRRVMTDTYAQRSGEEHIPGVTHDPVLRPIGALMVVVGSLWLLFWGMALEAGTLGQPKCAAALIMLGLLLGAVGQPDQQI